MSDVYGKDSFFVAYIKWHYGKGLKEFFGVASNFLWFLSNFFSFKLLLLTIFYPWKRLGEKYQGGFDFGAFASVFIINSLMRIFGFFSKIILIIIGFASYILAISLIFCFFVIWFLAPVVFVGSLIIGITFLTI